MYYKVVRKDKCGILKSHGSGLYPEATLVYLTTNWTQARDIFASAGYYPVVFSNFDNAWDFMQAYWYDDLEVWSCEIEDVIEEKPEMRGHSFLRDPQGLIWRGIQPCRYWMNWPAGTVMVKRVRLLERACGAYG